MRLTHALVQVAVAILEEGPSARIWGYDLAKKAGVRSGVLYPMLSGLLDRGWLTDRWEDLEDVRGRKRPPRRYYEVTDAGLAGLGALCADARRDARFTALLAGPAS